MHDPPDDTFTLQTMLALRQAVEEIGDEAGRRRPLAAFTAYADAFVAHVPRDDGEAVESCSRAISRSCRSCRPMSGRRSATISRPSSAI